MNKEWAQFDIPDCIKIRFKYNSIKTESSGIHFEQGKHQ